MSLYINNRVQVLCRSREQLLEVDKLLNDAGWKYIFPSVYGVAGNHEDRSGDINDMSIQFPDCLFAYAHDYEKPYSNSALCQNGLWSYGLLIDYSEGLYGPRNTEDEEEPLQLQKE